MATPRRIFLLGAMWLALVKISLGEQGSPWRVFGVADGLPVSSATSISLGPQGKILFTHSNSNVISELDGYHVTTFPGPGFSKAKIVASPSGQLWMATTNGLLEWVEGSWILHRLPEMTTSAAGHLARVPVLALKQGRVLFLLRDRLMEFNIEEPDRPKTLTLRSIEQTQLGEFLGLTLSREGGVWISGSRGVARMPGPIRNLKADTQWLQNSPPESLGLKNFREPRTDGEDGLILLAESNSQESVIVRFDGSTWTVIPASGEKIRFAWRTPDQTIWAATEDSLLEFRSDHKEPIESAGISGRKILDVAVEPNGAFWLAMSEGIFRHAPAVWQNLENVSRISASVQNLFEPKPGELWFLAGTNKFCALGHEQLKEISLPTGTFSGSSSNLIMWPIPRGFLLAARDRWIHLEFLSNALNKISAEPAQAKILGTWGTDGLVTEAFDSKPKDQPALALFDGVQFKPLPIPSPEGINLGQRVSFFLSRNRDVWLGCEHGVARYHGQKWRAFPGNDPAAPEAAEHFLEMPDERIWCAANGRIWEFDGQHWSVIRGGLDRIRSLIRTADGIVWTAGEHGLFRYSQNAWIQNNAEDGLPDGMIHELFESSEHQLWAATSNGLSLFHPSADSDVPKTMIQKLSQAEKLYEGGTITLQFDGVDKWKLTHAERLLYSSRLDQHEWSPFQEVNTLTIPDLAAGKHFFQVRALDRNGNMETPPAQLEFAVILPWYREIRVVLISVVGGVIALFFAGLALNRHRQLRRSYAEIELKVAERTQQLEVANRELLHSQKMNALGTLAAGIAHDFNNVLSIVKGSAQIIEDNLENPEKVRTRVDRIKTVVDQGSGIVKAMLGFSRESENPQAPCDVNQVVEDTLKLLGDRFLREVEVKFMPALELPEVAVSKDFIQQILLNLVFNAAEASIARKQIIISTQRRSKLPFGITLLPVEAAEYIAIRVQDFGCGITPENLPRIFEPFFTTKALSTRRGTGLGLSMAYELAKKIEAGLAVESAVNQGSTFTVILPVRENAANAVSVPVSSNQEPS